MESSNKIFIYIHAFFGGVGLITEPGSVLIKKGSKPHKNMGKLFSLAMFISSLISIPITLLPNHENLFLLLIGIFTIYLVVSGNRVLLFKLKKAGDTFLVDQLISGTMLVLSLLMILYGSYGLFKGSMGFLLFLFFGGFGLFLTIKDFIFLKIFKLTNNGWLSNHISKMLGALIASFTAFVVAGLGLDTLIAWVLPSVLGTCYIVYWQRKLRKATSL